MSETKESGGIVFLILVRGSENISITLVDIVVKDG